MVLGVIILVLGPICFARDARLAQLSLDEETKLMDSLHPRFQRFVRFALGTGARLEGIRGVDADRDVNWHDGTVHVVGKFKKERDIPMQPDAQAALVEQIEAESRLWKQNPQRLRVKMARSDSTCAIIERHQRAAGGRCARCRDR